MIKKIYKMIKRKYNNQIDKWNNLIIILETNYMYIRVKSKKVQFQDLKCKNIYRLLYRLIRTKTSL